MDSVEQEKPEITVVHLEDEFPFLILPSTAREYDRHIKGVFVKEKAGKEAQVILKCPHFPELPFTIIFEPDQGFKTPPHVQFKGKIPSRSLLSQIFKHSPPYRSLRLECFIPPTTSGYLNGQIESKPDESSLKEGVILFSGFYPAANPEKKPSALYIPYNIDYAKATAKFTLSSSSH